jgi:death-on-curing protein
MDAFIEVNGYRLTLTDDEAYELTIQVAQGQMSKVDLAGILTQALELVD